MIIGSNIRYLMSVQPNSLTKDVKETFKQLRTDLKEAELFVTISFLDEYFSKNEKVINQKSSPLLGKEQSMSISKIALSLERTLLSEAKTKMFYSLHPTRFSADYLLNNPDKLLRNDNFNKLNELSRLDFSAGCRCLSYGEPTAAAFFLLRSIEGALKQYYNIFIKSKKLAKHKQMWGLMTEALRKRKTNKPEKSLIDSLDLVRISYRNPTQHPEKIYDLSEAEDLMGVSIDLLNKLANQLPVNVLLNNQ